MKALEHENLQRKFKARSGRYPGEHPTKALLAFAESIEGSDLRFDPQWIKRASIKLRNRDRATIPVVDEFYKIVCVAIIDRGGDYFTGNLSNQV